MHDVCPDRGWYVPALHNAATAPPPAQEDPGGQTEHTVDEAEDVYPAAQGDGELAPVAQYDPGVHALQVA